MTAGLAQGRVNPERDAAREAKRDRRAGRGTVSKDVEFHVFHDGAEWICTEVGDHDVLSRGQTPTSAIIGAEIKLFKRAR